jgi:hypothetical protein
MTKYAMAFLALPNREMGNWRKIEETVVCPRFPVSPFSPPFSPGQQKKAAPTGAALIAVVAVAIIFCDG